MKKKHEVIINPEFIEVNGTRLSLNSKGIKMLREVYMTKIGDYPKFYKMDVLCQLGFIASELLLLVEDKERFIECNDRATLLFGKSSSICTDLEYQSTISDENNFFPSPSLFIYTLPNIVTGEIAYRNKYHGETSYFIVDNPLLIEEYIDSILNDSSHLTSAICGWVDVANFNDFETVMWIVEKNN